MNCCMRSLQAAFSPLALYGCRAAADSDPGFPGSTRSGFLYHGPGAATIFPAVHAYPNSYICIHTLCSKNMLRAPEGEKRPLQRRLIKTV